MKLLLKFFANSQTKAYLRGLAEELGENTNAIRVELNRLSEAGLLTNRSEGNMVWYQANISNPFFGMLQALVRKYMGLEDIIDSIVKLAGNIELAYIKGDYAKGIDSGVVDLVLIGDAIDMEYINKLKFRGEQLSGRNINLTLYNSTNFDTTNLLNDSNKVVVLYKRDSSS